MYDFYEFFAGGGMARLGLGAGWRCLYANDISVKKSLVYRRNFNDAQNVLHVGDIAQVKTSELPGQADLAWGSFPCQDLSLAGAGAGLQGARSGTFWAFWKILCELVREDRNPKVVVLENVQGALTSHGGADFSAIVEAFDIAGYSVGALTMDAAYFLPQSRPRLFFVAVHRGISIPRSLLYDARGPSGAAERVWHSDRLLSAQAALPHGLRQAWLWWRMGAPDLQVRRIADLLEPDDAVAWDSPETTERLVGMMSDIHRHKVRLAQHANARVIGTVYRRTRLGVQRAEVRFDGVSGCLRTPEGGSSRQTVLRVHGEQVRSRLLTAREAARLMGLPDSYLLPANYNEAYHIAGDGLAVPVVSWMERHLLRPLLEGMKDATVSEQTQEAEFVLHA